MLTKQDVIDKLKQDIVNITFEKKGGGTRLMMATLMDIYIANPITEEDDATTTKKKTNDTALAVWDMEKMEWRSFIWENLRTFGSVVLPNGIK